VQVLGKQVKFIRHRGPHRENYEIVNDILQFVASKYSCNIAEVTFAASLTYNQQKRYLTLLTAKGLILISSESHNCKGYEISSTGRKYLQVLAEIEDDLRPMSLEDNC
jgi:predicted transcriptional regulator